MAPLTAQQIAAALEGRRNGSGWIACCPSHDDRDPSLSISEGDAGPLVHCFAGCAQTDVIAALRDRGLWPEHKPKAPPARPQAATAREWTYTDADGAPILRVMRFATADGGKTFRQSVPDGAGGWRFGGLPRGTPPPLYGLPLPEGVAIITEGEKARDAASAALQATPGFTATCWPGGVANARSVDLTPLHGRTVVLWPDNDPPGIEAMRVIAQRLSGIARAVHIVDVSDMPMKADAADLDPAEVRRRLLAALQSGETAEPAKPRFVLRRACDIELHAPNWLVRGFLERDTLALLFGDPASGKSFVALDLAACLAAGCASFHGLDVCAPGPAVYIAGEGQHGLRRRCGAWARHHGITLADAPLFLSRGAAALTDAEMMAYVAEAVDAIGTPPVLIVLDTLARNIGPMADENSTRDMGAAIAGADSLRERYGCAVLLVHHSGHGAKDRARGSTALRAAVDAEYRVSRDPGGILELSCTKAKDHAPLAPMAFRFVSVGLGVLDDQGAEQTSAALELVDGYAPPIPAPAAGNGKWQGVALEALAELHQHHRDNLEAADRDPDEARVSVEEWREVCGRLGVPRQRFFALKQSTLVRVDGGFVWPA